MTGDALAAWQSQAEQTARQDASLAARLAGLIDAALTAAAAADRAGQSALARLTVPALSPPPTVERLGLVGGDFGPVGIGPLPPAPLPSCPTTPPPPAPKEDEHGWAYNAFGAFGSGAWKVGPGTVGDLVGLIPLDAAQAVDDATDDLYQDMSDNYGADTDSGVYRGVELTTQAGGFLLTGGAAAIRAIPAAVRAVPVVVRAVPGAVRTVPGVLRSGAAAAARVGGAVRDIRLVTVVTPQGGRFVAGLDLRPAGLLLNKADEARPHGSASPAGGRSRVSGTDDGLAKDRTGAGRPQARPADESPSLTGDGGPGAPQAAAPVPRPPTTAASVDDKLRRYLLNLDHPVGGSKAAWFRDALGFTTENSGDLARQLVFDPSRAYPTKRIPHGQLYNESIALTGANGRRIEVVVSWIRNEDGVVRLVTAVPTKK